MSSAKYDGERDLATPTARFEAWYKLVDLAVGELAGLGIDDLPDGPSWDAWEDGVSPDEYARERLEEDGFPF